MEPTQRLAQGYYIQLWTAHFRGDIGKLETGDQREKGLKT